MKKNAILLFCFLLLGAETLYAQTMTPIPIDSASKAYIVKINTMDEIKQQQLNAVAAKYRLGKGKRNIWTAMAAGGISAMVDVTVTEIINLTKIRSMQKREWTEMRMKECVFVDSMQSVKGQTDFYRSPSVYGPLDPSNMDFDGITLNAYRDGKHVLMLICHIDTACFSEIFLHSKFRLVLDSLAFYPYNSFLPNLSIDTTFLFKEGKTNKKLLDYWCTIRQFDFNEQQKTIVHVSLDITSSWINDLTQVFHDVSLGTFYVDIPIQKQSLKDSVFVYSRATALANEKPTIDLQGSSFVVPRSFMPVDASHPSWGTGEYKIKITLSETCQFNPNGKRAKKWHHDYKLLKKLQNAGKSPNDYLKHIITTLHDQDNMILKATYGPGVNNILKEWQMQH